jgi:putative transposase
MNLKVNDVLRSISPDAPFVGLHRVLWIWTDVEDIGRVMTVEIPCRVDGEPSPRYFKAPVKRSLPDVLIALDQSELVISKLTLPPIAYLPDESIRKIYSQRTTPTKRRLRTDSASLQKRDRQWALVEPIMRYIQDHPADAFETEVLAAMICDRISKTRCRRADINDALHRLLALGCGKNALLSSHQRCGGRGKSRAPKNCTRLGRKNAAFVAGEVESPGIHLSLDDKQKLAMGWNRFLRQGKSVKAAYSLTCGAWWSEGVKLVDGEEVPILLPAKQRPTEAQFRFWGPRDAEGKSAFELLLAPNAWEKKYRPKLGSSFSGLTSIGQMGLMDATSNDVNLVSMVSRLKALGPANRLFLHEGLSDAICGVNCSLDAPSERTALLTILNAATDKVEFCKRFGVTITPDQFPTMFFGKIRVDNGELRTKGAIDAMSAVGSAIEFVERHRPERKGRNEAGHRSIHKLLDHRLDGTTRGRQRQRGEDHSAIAACWTWFEYMCELLRAIVYYNCHLDASALMREHPFHSEMARDSVPPNRAAIHAWCIKNNRIAIPPFEVDLLRAHLLPSIQAVVRQNGVFLLRPDRGDKPEIVWGARFSGQRMIELGWHKGTLKTRYIDVKYDPDNLNKVWFLDALGMHCLKNLSDDTLRHQQTLADLLAMTDQEHLQELKRQDEDDQARSDFISHREHVNSRSRRAKNGEIKAANRKISKTEIKSNMGLNRQQESMRIDAMLDPITRMPISKSSASDPIAPAQPEGMEHGVVSAAVAAFRKIEIGS